jgi:hypothetical protein
MLSVRPRVLRNEARRTASLGRSFAPTTVVQPPYRIPLKQTFGEHSNAGSGCTAGIGWS